MTTAGLGRRPVPRPGRRAVAWVAGLGGLAAALARLHVTGGVAVAPVPLCPLHALTGLWCPVCGSLRAAAALTHLDPAGALSSNLLVTLLLPLLAVDLAAAVVSSATGRALPRLAVGNRGWAALAVVFAVFTVWRNLPALPGADFLAP